MRMIHSAATTVHHYPRMTQDDFTLVEAIKTYFTILFGVAVFVLSYYYLFPQVR